MFEDDEGYGGSTTNLENIIGEVESFTHSENEEANEHTREIKPDLESLSEDDIIGSFFLSIVEPILVNEPVLCFA